MQLSANKHWLFKENAIFIFTKCTLYKNRSASVCVLTQRPGQPETSQRVEGAHDGSDGSDPHGDGVMVGVLWAFWESPRLHQQKMFHSADTHMFRDLLDETPPLNTQKDTTCLHPRMVQKHLLGYLSV